MPVTRTTKKTKPAVVPSVTPAVDFNSLALKIEAGNHLAIRLYGDLIDVFSVAEHTRKIFGAEEVGKALRKLTPIEGMPVIPSPLEPSSFSPEVWYKLLHLFTKACVRAPGLKMGTFRTCKTHEGTRSTVLRWAAMLAAWKPIAPLSGPVLDLPGAMPAGEEASAARISALEHSMAEMSAMLKVLVAQGAAKAAIDVPKDTAGVSITNPLQVNDGAGAGANAKGAKRGRGVAWADEISGVVAVSCGCQLNEEFLRRQDRRMRGAFEGNNARPSRRDKKTAMRAARKLKVDIPPKKRVKSEKVCKFGDTCREFMKGEKCGYLHRS